MVLNIGRYPNSKNVKLLNTENQNKKGGVFYNTKKMKMCEFGNMYNNQGTIPQNTSYVLLPGKLKKKTIVSKLAHDQIIKISVIYKSDIFYQ